MTNWKKYKFSDFVDINPTVKISGNGLVSYVEMKDLNEGNKYCFPSDNRVANNGSRFQNNDTLFARITPCLENGKICQVKNLNSNIGFGSTEFLVFRGKDKISNTDFTYYLSRWDRVRSHAELSMTGTSGRQRVQKSAFDELEINLPPLPEQQAIASILSSLDDKIELNRRQNETLEKIAQAIFKHWFVDFEFSDANGKPYRSSGGEMQESELGMIPKGWRVGKIGDIYETTSGGTPSRAIDGYYEDGKIMWVKSKELNNSFILETEEKINDIGLKNSSAKLLPAKSVLIALYGATVGQTGILSDVATSNQAICALLPNNEYPYTFIFQFLKMNQTNILNFAVGSAQQNISQIFIKEFPIIIPPLDVLNLYSLHVNNLFNKIENNLKQNRTLSQLRDGLLPKLMSGKVRVK